LSADDVENLGHGRQPSCVLKRLADDGRQSAFEPGLNFLNDLGACLSHIRYAANHCQLPILRQPGNYLSAIAGWQMGHNEGNRLRMLVIDERHEMLRIYAL
jgi:hypothetical protein